MKTNKKNVGPDEAFAEAMQSNPNDYTAKLVYAEWLDDKGEHVRAEYIRADVDVAINGPDDGREERRAAAGRALDALLAERLHGDEAEQENREKVLRSIDVWRGEMISGTEAAVAAALETIEEAVSDE